MGQGQCCKQTQLASAQLILCRPLDKATKATLMPEECQTWGRKKDPKPSEETRMFTEFWNIFFLFTTTKKDWNQ